MRAQCAAGLADPVMARRVCREGAEGGRGFPAAIWESRASGGEDPEVENCGMGRGIYHGRHLGKFRRRQRFEPFSAGEERKRK